MQQAGYTELGTQIPPNATAGPVKNPAVLPQQPGLPTPAYTGYPGDGYTRPGYEPDYQPGNGPCNCPLPTATFGQWRPPGIGGTWPPDEYICDGGGSPQIKVRSDFTIEGLKPEEAIGHFDTIDGRTIVEPTNKVCIYAPRFAAVRKVDTPFSGNEFEGLNKAMVKQKANQEDELNIASTAMAPVPPIGAISARPSLALVDEQKFVQLGGETIVASVQDHLKAYEDFSYIRTGVMLEEDKAVIAQRVQAAITWTNNQAVQVTIDGKRATAVHGDQRAEALFEVDVPNHPCLQICKIASTDNAKPGETVDFTIRFDNVGDQKMGNVTIVDNLTTRLEYVPGTAKSSLKANFAVQPNEVGSLVLRWEIIDPLKPGDGGVVRFQCKVR